MSVSRREEILEAALDSFAATGGTAIEEVRQRSGASVGSIYHHFGGVDGIAAALYVQILRGYQEGVGRALARAAGGKEGVEALVRHHLRWVERHPERARFLLQNAAARAEVEEELAKLNRNLSAELAEWIERQRGIREMPFEVFYAAVIGPAQELSRHWLAGRVRSLRRLEDELAATAWRAVRRAA